jgi:hypothetical protein
MRTLWAKWLKVAPWLAALSLLLLILAETLVLPHWLFVALVIVLFPSMGTVFYLNDRNYRESLYLRGYNDGKAKGQDDQGNS